MTSRDAPGDEKLVDALGEQDRLGAHLCNTRRTLTMVKQQPSHDKDSQIIILGNVFMDKLCPLGADVLSFGEKSQLV